MSFGGGQASASSLPICTCEKHESFVIRDIGRLPIGWESKIQVGTNWLVIISFTYLLLCILFYFLVESQIINCGQIYLQYQ